MSSSISCSILSILKLTYNPKGQREKITYGNGTKTEYEYESTTYRLTNRVYQSDELFDPNFVSSWVEKGKTIPGTNIERMASGIAALPRCG
jgi:filamentous hemagglutinin